MHDFDNNSFLDGLEILQAISHVMPDDDDGKPQRNTGYQQPGKRWVNEEDNQKQAEDDLNYFVGKSLNQF